MNKTDPITVSRTEAARLLGVSYVTMKRLAKRGAIAEIRYAPNSHPRLRLEDVLALAERTAVK